MSQDSRIALEIIDIERHDISHAMHEHRGDKPRVMSFHAAHRILRYETLPFAVDIIRFKQQREKGFVPRYVAFGSGGCIAKTITPSSLRPGTNHPELHRVLGQGKKLVSCLC